MKHGNSNHDEPNDVSLAALPGERQGQRTARRSHAFTLIELLVVVAVIAILAAIAVPNFLEARTRSFVARTMADQRTLATALELYRVDANRYPPHGERLASGVFNIPATAAGLGTLEFFIPGMITTPVAYLVAEPLDPLAKPGLGFPFTHYGYVESTLTAAILRSRGLNASADAIFPAYGGWRLYASGPDGDRGRDTKLNVPYDPTNGTVSDGDIIRTQREPIVRQAGDE